MKTLVTGHKGYIGSVMVKQLLEEGFEVIGCDVGFYPLTDFWKKDSYDDVIKVPEIKKDVRDLTKSDVKGVDAIVHLAALSNDPLGYINPKLTNEINFDASTRLAEIAKNAGVRRFLFSSSCSVYGGSGDKSFLTERSEVAPLTPYAESKILTENKLLKMSDKNFVVTVLRSATAFGASPRMRFDLIVNNLCGYAYTTHEILILSDGTAWRPNIHIEDIGTAFVKVLSASPDEINVEVFNIGSNSENFQIKDIAEIVAKIIPASEVKLMPKASKDKRSYKVDFSKIKKTLEFNTKWTVKKGVKELYEVMKNASFGKAEFKNTKYHTIDHIKKLLNSGKIDSNFRVVKNYIG